MSLKDRLAGYKTLIAAGLVTTAGTLAAVPDQLQQLGVDWKAQIPQVVPIKMVGYIILGLGLLFGLLRLVTRTPSFQSYPSATATPNYPPVPPDLEQYAPQGPPR